ncbi:MAG: GGDEF domain-containing protein [Butyrivibrio sp.]|nr:GGDEF domain-containing protein [Butyrivibrio sp.]
MNKVLNVLLYGAEKSCSNEYINEKQRQLNQKTIGIISVLLMIAFIVASVITIVTGGTLSYTLKMESLYLFIPGFFITAFIYYASQKSKINLHITMLLYFECFMAIIIITYLGTIRIPNDNAVLVNVALIIFSVFIHDRPIDIYLFNLISVTVFMFFSYSFKDAEHFGSDLVNIIITFIVACIIAWYQQNKRYLQWNLDYKFEREREIDKFVNDMVKLASEADIEGNTIDNILKYIGESLNAERAYIFEGEVGGYYDNTYEWYKKGTNSYISDLKNIAYKGVLDTWIEEYEKSNNVMIYDIEEYKKISDTLYNMLKALDIHTLVTGPIHIDGEIVGFYGVDNPPIIDMEKVSEVIDFTEFVFSVLIRYRNNTAKLKKAGFHDELTGLSNRHALMEKVEDKENDDIDDKVILIMCDLNGLKEVNDTKGHKEGDDYLKRGADCLISVFGKESTYRFGGDEYLVVEWNLTREEVDRQIEQVKEELERQGVSMALGVLYKEHFDQPIDDLIKEADMIMYEDKKKYYEMSGKDRRRR